MTVAELRAEVRRKKKLGHEYIQLVVGRRYDPRGQQVRVMPGVTGRFVGRVGAQRILVDCRIDAIELTLSSHANIARFLARKRTP